MKKNILAFGAVAVISLGGFIAYNAVKNNDHQIVLSYGKGQGIDGEISSFNPAQADTTANAIGLHNEIAELMAFDKKGDLVNYAAKSIESSKDASSITVTLKDGLKYEDNTNVTAKDYLNGAKLLAMPQSKSDYAMWVSEWVKGGKEFASGKSKEISGFKVLGTNKFKIDLTTPKAFFKTTFASEMWAPIPDHFIAKIGGLQNYGKDEKHFLSSGPLKIKSFHKGAEMLLEKNDKTSLAKNIPVSDVKLVPVNVFSAGAMQFKQHKLYAIEKTQQSDQILGKTKSSIANQKFAFSSMEYISVNKQTVDTNLAKAISLAIDKNYINNKFFYGTNQVRSVITPNTYKNVEQQLKQKGVDTNKNEFDYTQAKQLAKPYKGKNLTILLKAEKQSLSQYDSYYKYVKSQLESLGLNISFKVLPSQNVNNEVYKNANESRTYDLVFNSWSNDYPEASTFVNSILGSHTSNNFSAWTSAKYDNETQQAMKSIDENQAGSHYANAVIEAKNNFAIIPVLQYNANVYTQDGKEAPYSIAGIKYVNFWK